MSALAEMYVQGVSTRKVKAVTEERSRGPFGETLNFYSLPRQHHKHLKSTNMLERLNEEIKRRTRVVRIFPNPASCLRLVRAQCAETHEGWLEDHHYLNMEYLKEQKKDVTRIAA